MEERNKRQGGWIVAFVAIGGLLVLGLIAGLYYFKTTVDQARVAEASQTAGGDQNSKDEDSDNSKSTDTNKQDSASGDDRSNDSTDSASTSADDKKNQGSKADTDDTSNNTLPQTGPEESLLTPAATALFAFSAVTYIRSRNTLTSVVD